MCGGWGVGGGGGWVGALGLSPGLGNLPLGGSRSSWGRGTNSVGVPMGHSVRHHQQSQHLSLSV